MRIPLFQIDAFTGRLFSGNPAAVCPLEEWLPEPTMQAIAAENNLSETAFLVREGDGYAIRWFTPAQEVDLCGHATLASAFVVFQALDRGGAAAVTFQSKSGPLQVTREGDLLVMDFPAWEPRPCETPADLLRGLGARPEEVLATRDYLCVFRTEDEVRALRPDMAALVRLDKLGVIVTAAGREHDFVSRFFAPGAGVPEDPVTGSAHCTLTPYWARRLGKDRLWAAQVSARGGELRCTSGAGRVGIAGRAVKYLEGTIELR